MFWQIVMLLSRRRVVSFLAGFFVCTTILTSITYSTDFCEPDNMLKISIAAQKNTIEVKSKEICIRRVDELPETTPWDVA